MGRVLRWDSAASLPAEQAASWALPALQGAEAPLGGSQRALLGTSTISSLAQGEPWWAGVGQFQELVSGSAMEANTAASVGDAELAEEVVPETTLDDVIGEVEGSWGHCAALYFHGSTIFGNKKPTDIDLLAIVDEPTLKPVKAATTDAQFTLGPYEVSVYTRSFWLRKLEEMDLTMLTCLSLPPEFVVRALDDERARGLTIDLDKLSEAIISYAEYTWLKARRVLLRWEDPHKSSKNVYFVFRVIELGRQLVEHGSIVDFTAANHWWEHIHGAYESLDVKPEPRDWDVVEAILASDFHDEVVRFQAGVERAKRGSADAAVGGQPEETPGSCRPEPGEDACPVCLDSIVAGEGAAQGRPEGPRHGAYCALVNCRHRFHLECIAASVRSAPGQASCPLCRGSLRLGFDEEHAVARELERRGIREGARPSGRPAPGPRRQQGGTGPPWRGNGHPASRRRRYGGYPATVLLPEEPTPEEEQEAAPAAEHTEVPEEPARDDEEVPQLPPGEQEEPAEVEGEEPAEGVEEEEEETAEEASGGAAVGAAEEAQLAAPSDENSEASAGSWEVVEAEEAGVPTDTQHSDSRCNIA